MLVLLTLLLPWPLDDALLAVEDSRGDPAALIEALATDDTGIELQALRALGRFERPELASHVLPFLDADAPEVRIEAANALAQMGARPTSLVSRLEVEKTPSVRAALYEALGRLPEAKESLLTRGLGEPEPVRFGAAKGLESWLRRGNNPAGPSTVTALRKAVRTSRGPTRELALLALAAPNGAGDRDVETLEAAWRDESPLVRRLALLGLKTWRSDPSPIVRYAALRAAPSCTHAEESLDDPSAHVVLLAIDTLGALGCRTESLEAWPDDRPQHWRRGAHALVALAKIDPGRARRRLPSFRSHPVWQARVYAARAAQILDDEDTLRTLRNDPQPNVVAAALVTTDDALRALESDDYGLLVAALNRLEGAHDPAAVPLLEKTLRRVTRQRRATSRDPRRLLIERLAALDGIENLDYLLDDFDPFIAELAASVLSGKTGRKTQPKTTRFVPSRLPDESYLRGLEGARIRFTMKEAGPFVVTLLPDEAPLTCARVAALAESGYYDGLTFHRIVPNFVIQGGSPGANEYVGTSDYLRDEVSRLSHERGTLGISTRGRDTGDAQIFVNLVNNYRLDHNYTVFARVTEGMENVDRIQEGDVMQSVEVLRR